jgi:hypothetical protein
VFGETPDRYRVENIGGRRVVLGSNGSSERAVGPKAPVILIYLLRVVVDEVLDVDLDEFARGLDLVGGQL